ncbi:MAG: hypothetical protein R2854_28570 [Caldilineaceae bacterium]
MLAVGDMHWPNRLNIPGEDLPTSLTISRPHDYFQHAAAYRGRQELRGRGGVALLAPAPR